jgi:outer membrane protein assembly factor BamB
LAPQGPSVPICENFTVNVTVSSVQDLYSWNLNMTFNSTCMECVDFEEGPFLSSNNATLFTAPVIDNTAGTITGANCTFVNASNGVSGDGTLANATFQCKDVVGQGTFNVSNIELYNSTSVEIYSGNCSDVVYQIPTVTYRLLAVEQHFSFSNSTSQYNFPQTSAEYLIQALRGFKNWQNVTVGAEAFGVNYRCYIHLLSEIPYSKLGTGQMDTPTDSDMKNYYVGEPSNTSILNQITTFLSATGPGESNDLTVRIFYYNGHGDRDIWEDPNTTPYLDHVYHYLIPPSGDVINDSELNQALNTGDLATSNCTLVILDSCTSGGFITDECNATAGVANVTRLGRVILTATTEGKSDYAYDIPTENYSIFTGNENACYYNSTTGEEDGSFGPLGIIGGLYNAKDDNLNGWRTAGEVFYYAWNTVVNYTNSVENAWSDWDWSSGTYTAPKTHPQSPCEWSGVAGGDIPLVLYNPTMLGVENPCYNGAPEWPPPLLPPSDWPQFGDGPNRGRVGPSWSLGATSSIPATTLLPISAASSAAVVDGTVFVATLGGAGAPSNVSALNIATGQVIWTFTATGTIYSSPAVVDGMVFIGTLGGGGGGGAGGWLYALDEYTGLVRWEFEVPNGLGIVSSPAVANGTVFVATMQQSSTTPCAVYALNETSGISIWNFTTTAPIESSPTCANGLVFVGTLNGIIYALNASTTSPVGQQLWSYPFPTGNEIISTAAADSSSIYVGTMYIGGGGGGKVYAFNQFTGATEWQFPNSPAPLNFSSSPAIDTSRNLVLIASDNGVVYALNNNTGTLAWPTVTIGPVNMSSMAISSDGLMYIGSTNGYLYCLNETNLGAVVWSYHVGGSIIASPALTYQHVIISSTGTGGSVQCIGPPFPVHDTGVYKLSALPSTLTVGNTVNITFTATNNGNVNETFQVSCLCNNTLIGMYVEPTLLYAENVTLLPGTNITITFTWNTTGFIPDSYTIIAHATPVSGETNMADNTLFDGTVQVLQIIIGGEGSRVPYLD